jgi:hypothetical protein
MPVAVREREVGACDLDADPVAGRKVVSGGDADDPDAVDLAGHELGRPLEAVAVTQAQAAVGEVVGGPVRIDVHEFDEYIRVFDVGRHVQLRADVADDRYRLCQHGSAVHQHVGPAFNHPLIHADRVVRGEVAAQRLHGVVRVSDELIHPASPGGGHQGAVAPQRVRGLSAGQEKRSRLGLGQRPGLAGQPGARAHEENLDLRHRLPGVGLIAQEPVEPGVDDLVVGEAGIANGPLAQAGLRPGHQHPAVRRRRHDQVLVRMMLLELE